MDSRDIAQCIASHLLPIRAQRLREVSRTWRAGVEVVYPLGLMLYLRAVKSARAAEISREVLCRQDETYFDVGYITYTFRRRVVMYVLEGTCISFVQRDTRVEIDYAMYPNGSLRDVRAGSYEPDDAGEIVFGRATNPEYQSLQYEY